MTLADIQGIAHELALSYASVEISYRKLVQAVHDTKDIYTPKQIRATLLKHLNKSRISEIMRVAYTNEIIYNDYLNRIIGFRLALKRTRTILDKQMRCLRWYAEFDRIQETMTQTVYRSGDKIVVVMVEESTINKKVGDITIKAKYEKTGIN